MFIKEEYPASPKIEICIWEFLFCIVEGILDRGTLKDICSGLSRGFHEVFARISRGFLLKDGNVFIPKRTLCSCQ